MNEQLINQVEELGLSNKEARVYLANLMLGPAGVQQIADTSGIKRVTTYVILESLVSLGLVSQTTKAKKTLFNAESPENLRRLLDKKEQSVQEQKHQLEELLPDLAKLTLAADDAPVVKFYDGVESIQTIYDTLPALYEKHKDREPYGITNLDSLYEFFPQIDLNKANPARLQSGVSSKILYTSAKGPVLEGTDKDKNRQSRFMPIDKYPFNADISVIGDQVIMLTLQGPKPVGVTIKSDVLSGGFRALFNLLWEAASAPTKK